MRRKINGSDGTTSFSTLLWMAMVDGLRKGFYPGLLMIFSEELVSDHLMTSELIEHNLLILTSGEIRLSNFMLGS